MSHRNSTPSSLDEISCVFKLTLSDVNTSISKLNSSSEEEFDFYARTYIRALASWIESSLWMHKLIIQKADEKWYLQLPIEMQLYLLEYDWKIDSASSPSLTEKKIPTKQNLKAFFKVMQQMFSGYEGVNFGTDGWKSVLDFYKLRDQMMHPSGVQGLTFTKQEIERCDDGRLWLNEQFLNVRTQIQTKYNLRTS